MSSRAVSSYKLASVLLQYPTVELLAGLDHLDRAVSGLGTGRSRECFTRFIGWLRATPSTEVAQHYVTTFDLQRCCTLYLTYYRHGDTRKRGMALLEFKAAYRVAGFTPPESELPDYLPLALEFADLCPRGRELLRRHRADLELVRRVLAESATPYADVVEAVCAELPKPKKRDWLIVRQAWEKGPPAEDVGLEPFAPPEYLTGKKD